MIPKPISAINKKGHPIPTDRLDLPENAQVHFVLVDINKMNEIQLEMERAEARDYFNFEKENDSIPSEEELNYYYKLATHETR